MTNFIGTLINPIDRDALKAQFDAGKPHRYFAIDNFLDESFANAVLADYPTFEEAMAMGRSFKAVNERLKVQVTDSAKFKPNVLKLHEALASREFLDLVEHVTSIPKLLADPTMAGAGMHQTGPSGHLDVHVDFNRLQDPRLFRRLNILVYLNKGWEEGWGGNFELWDKDVKHLQQTFEPLFNRCVMFETTNVSYHGVSAVKCPEGQSRKSFAAYYYTVEAPSHYDGTDYNTIFKPRPDEYLKGNVLMPLESTKRWLSKSVSKLKQSVKGH